MMFARRISQLPPILSVLLAIFLLTGGAAAAHLGIGSTSRKYLAKKHDNVCKDPEYRQNDLKLIKEIPFIGLFPDLQGNGKFEASGTCIAHDKFWVVFDNLRTIGSVDVHFDFRGKRNHLIGELGDDSQFEGLVYSETRGTFFVIHETHPHPEMGLVPVAEEIKISDDNTTYSVINKCPVDYELTHENKGFEGLLLHEHEDEIYIMGLCEGNHCYGGEKGRDRGNGRIILARYQKDEDGCSFKFEKKIEIPSTANFLDYSGLAVFENKMGIISQEDSALWVGTFDFEKMEFDSDGVVYNFPRDGDCKVVYCNVEGIDWIDESRVVISSDKAKKTQPYHCTHKDQSIHIFALPFLDDSEETV